MQGSLEMIKMICNSSEMQCGGMERVLILSEALEKWLGGVVVVCEGYSMGRETRVDQVFAQCHELFGPAAAQYTGFHELARGVLFEELVVFDR